MGFIDRPQQVWWRKVTFQIHLWVGILLALYVIVISISGTVLIFGSEITDDMPSICSHEVTRQLLSAGDLAAAAQALHPDYRVASIEDGGWRSDASRIFLEKNTTDPKARSFHDVYLDPFTGRVLADRDNTYYKKRHPVYRFIEDLHVDLLAGRTGLKVNAICAAFLLLLCVTGIVVWWPGRKIWKQSLTVRWQARWKRVNFDSHRAIGFWTLLIVSMWAMTGVYFGYARPIRNMLAKVMPFAKSTPYPKTGWKPGDQMLPLDDLYRDAQQALPGERIRQISFPSRPGDPLYVSFEPNGAPHYLHSEQVLLDSRTGQVVRIRDSWKEGKAGDRLIRTLVMLHYAEFDSLPLRILFALLGLSPAVLAITGALMWWNRVLSKRWKRMRKANRGGLSQTVKALTQ